MHHGRTDAGVHSFGQVANFKTNSNIEIEKFPIAINSKLKKSIVIKSAEEVEEILTTKFAEVLATKNKGQIMKAVMGDLKGKADGKLINLVVADFCK